MSDLLNMISPYVRKAAYDVLGTPHYITERVIYDYELLFIKEGNPIITIEDDIYHACKGEVYLFRPGQRHSISLTEKGLFIQPHVHFDLIYYADQADVDINFRPLEEMSEEEKRHIRPDLLAAYVPGLPVRFHLLNPQQIELQLFDLIQWFKGNDPYRELSIKWALMRILNQLLTENGYKTSTGKRDVNATSRQMRLYIEHKLRRNITLAEFEQIYHMDMSYLGRLFKRTYGVTPIKYHKQMRIAKSKELLVYTNASVSEVAEFLGFANIYDFSRAFKSVMGLAPSQWRAANGLSERSLSESRDE